MKPEILYTYGPKRLLVAARNETFFGPGQYRIAVPPRYAQALMRDWAGALLEDPLGEMLSVRWADGPSRTLHIFRSKAFDSTAHALGYDPRTLDITCATEAAQLDFLKRLRKYLEKST